MKTMQHAKDGLPDTSYVETSIGAATSSERAGVAPKDLFPKMSSSELEVSYNTKGRLQVKMWGGAGKKFYNLTTTEKSTGQEQINKSVPKEIRPLLVSQNMKWKTKNREKKEKIIKKINGRKNTRNRKRKPKS